MLRATVIICGTLLGLLLAMIALAFSQSGFWSGVEHLLANPWGIVTLMDLSVGLLFVAAWISVVEPRPLCAVLWIMALLVLGNIITMVFLLWRTRYANRFSDLFLPLSRQNARLES